MLAQSAVFFFLPKHSANCLGGATLVLTADSRSNASQGLMELSIRTWQDLLHPQGHSIFDSAGNGSEEAGSSEHDSPAGEEGTYLEFTIAKLFRLTISVDFVIRHCILINQLYDLFCTLE